MWMVPPAVNTPQAIALARGEDAEVVTNWKCSVVLLVLALAPVMLLPATTAANANVPAAAPKALRMMPPVR
jgi:aspartate-semialdehyde dehydrogenase